MGRAHPSRLRSAVSRYLADPQRRRRRWAGGRLLVRMAVYHGPIPPRCTASCGGDRRPEDGDQSRTARLRLLRERGRLGRSMLHGGIRYWIGHHRELGLLIFDPHAQREVETGKVRLFSVTEHESRLFMLDMARTRSLWSSPADHVEEMRKAVAEYGRARERQRETHCYWCRRDINSVDSSLCTRCGWIRCACGHCGCRYRGQPAAGADRDRRRPSSRSAYSAEGPTLP